jgi:hypothetical protein
MKIKSIFVAVLLMAGVVISPAANAATENPTVESFTFTPNEIDLQNQNTKVEFSLTVSHPFGIENQTIYATLTNDTGDLISTPLTRTENPLNPVLSRVVFKGSVEISRNVRIGVYSVSTTTIFNNRSAGYRYGIQATIAAKIRDLVGAEKSFLIRNADELNFVYKTFAGPSYDSSLGIGYKDSQKFNSSSVPFWSVGEVIKISDYYEKYVQDLPLKISTSTSSTCTTDGTELKLVGEGTCAFKVFTPKTNDYALVENEQQEVIGSARVKPKLIPPVVADQNISEFPKSIETLSVYGPASGWVLPQSITPQICIASGFFVKISNWGTCKLTYISEANSTYLASDKYTVSFEILKDGKPVVVPTPVPTPTPVTTPTPTAKPVVKKTITCVKGKKTIKKTAVSPKCPAGYKLKK